jgi:hypothetical protein
MKLILQAKSEEHNTLGCYTVQFADSLTCPRYISLPSSLLKSKPSTRPAETGLTYSSTHKMEATDMFLSKARLTPNYIDFKPRRSYSS